MGNKSINNTDNSNNPTSLELKGITLMLMKMIKLYRDQSEEIIKKNQIILDNLQAENKKREDEFKKLKLERTEKEFLIGEDLRRVNEEIKYLQRELEEFNSFKRGAIWRYLEKYRRIKIWVKNKTGVGSDSKLKRH